MIVYHYVHVWILLMRKLRNPASVKFHSKFVVPYLFAERNLNSVNLDFQCFLTNS